MKINEKFRKNYIEYYKKTDGSVQEGEDEDLKSVSEEEFIELVDKMLDELYGNDTRLDNEVI